MTWICRWLYGQITTTTTTTTTATTAVRRQAWEPFRLRGLPQCARTAYWITEIVGFHPFSPFHFTWRWTEKIICCFYASVMPVCPAKPRITPKTSRIPPLAAPVHLFFFCCWTKWITKSILCPLGRSHLILFLLQTLDQCVFFFNLTVKEGYFLSYLMHNSTLSMTPTMRWHSYTCLICHTWVTRESQMVISECESTPTVANYTREVARPHFHF